ncbi:MAG: hypothetical protein ACFCUO_07170 [Rhodospirillales bacterium]
MRLAKSLAGAAAIAAVALGGGSAMAMSTATIDATVNGAVWTLAGDTATAALPGFGAVSAVASVSPITQGEPFPYFGASAAAVAAAQAGTTFCAGAGGPLACDFDGFGVGDDEITQPNQSITLSWAVPASIVEIYLLDLFTNNPVTNDPFWTEQADITINGVTGSFFATATGGDRVGALVVTAADLIAQGLDVDLITSITFSAPDLGAACGATQNCNDFSVAGVKGVPIPLPGAVWLFGSGLLAMLGVGYTRRRRAAA